MSSFDDRENAFETKFAHDAELKFKVEARRDRLVADWAAPLLEKTPADYTSELIRADMTEAGAEDVIAKLVADLEGKASEQEIRDKVVECESLARTQIMNEIDL